MNEKLKSIVLFILERADNKDIPIGKTRLVKLLYLLDVEIYKLSKKTLTGLEWIFFKYGPYALEIEGFLDKIGVMEQDMHIGKGRFFSRLITEIDEEDIKVDIETKSVIEKLIEEWGTADLNELLDYVYFETEPMLSAEFSQRLDFSTIKLRAKEAEVDYSQETKEKLKELGKRLKDRLETIELPKDLFIRFSIDLKRKMQPWEEETKDLHKLSGKVNIKDGKL